MAVTVACRRREYPEFVEAMETLARTHKAGTVSDLSSTQQTPPTTRSTNDGSEPDEAGEEQREVQKKHMELMTGKQHVAVLPRQLSAGEQKPELPEKPPLIRVRRATPKKKAREEKKVAELKVENQGLPALFFNLGILKCKSPQSTWGFPWRRLHVTSRCECAPSVVAKVSCADV